MMATSMWPPSSASSGFLAALERNPNRFELSFLLHHLFERLEPAVGAHRDGRRLGLDRRQHGKIGGLERNPAGRHRERHAGGRGQDVVAVRGLVRERSHGDDARAARPIVDHESPAEKLAELLAQLTHHDVERRAGAGPT
jgi:hypothetical protein